MRMHRDNDLITLKSGCIHRSWICVGSFLGCFLATDAEAGRCLKCDHYEVVLRSLTKRLDQAGTADSLSPPDVHHLHDAIAQRDTTIAQLRTVTYDVAQKDRALADMQEKLRSAQQQLVEKSSQHVLEAMKLSTQVQTQPDELLSLRMYARELKEHEKQVEPPVDISSLNETIAQQDEILRALRAQLDEAQQKIVMFSITFDQTASTLRRELQTKEEELATLRAQVRPGVLHDDGSSPLDDGSSPLVVSESSSPIYSLLQDLKDPAMGLSPSASTELSPRRPRANSLSLDDLRFNEMEDNLERLQTMVQDLTTERDGLQASLAQKDLAERELTQKWVETVQQLQQEYQTSQRLKRELSEIRDEEIEWGSQELQDAQRTTIHQGHHIQTLKRTNDELQYRVQALELEHQILTSENKELARQASDARKRLLSMETQHADVEKELNTLHEQAKAILIQNITLTRLLHRETLHEKTHSAVHSSSLLASLYTRPEDTELRGLIEKVLEQHPFLMESSPTESSAPLPLMDP